MNEHITKPKNPGRVAAGQRLVAWNRKVKEDLLKNQVPSQVPGEVLGQVPSQVLSQVPGQVPTSTYGVGIAAIVIAIGVLVYFKIKNQKPIQKTIKQFDPFCQ